MNSSAGEEYFGSRSPQNLMGYNRKLRPRFKKLYWVVKTTSTAAFCRPTTKQKDSVENDDTDCLVKIEKRLLKKLKPTNNPPLKEDVLFQLHSV